MPSRVSESDPSGHGVRGAALPVHAELRFGVFSLPGPQGPLQREDAFQRKTIELAKKPLQLLWMLACNPGRVLAKDELLKAVWMDAEVTEGVLSTCLKEIRRALGDDARVPVFIATAHGIGYRFVAPVQRAVPAEPSLAIQADEGSRSGKGSGLEIVGRSLPLAELQSAFMKAQQGERQLVFVTGEAGIGKTSLVRQFNALVPSLCKGHEPAPLWAHGQCIETFGSGEPYLPFLEAITRLCQSADGQRIQELLKHLAPSWLDQLAHLREPDTLASEPASRGVAASARSMQREMAQWLDAVSQERMLILVLENMHWSDSSSVDLLSMIAMRSERARMLVIVTTRHLDLLTSAHPLHSVRQQLAARSLAVDIPLHPLAASDVAQYVGQRFPQTQTQKSATLAADIFRHTKGHPLFMTHVADAVIHGGNGLASADLQGLPAQLTDMISAQLRRLPPPEFKTLEAASVVGAVFTSAAVAAALEQPIATVETCLANLAQHSHFIEPRGVEEWRDGTVCGRYGFRHDTYREVLFQQLGEARRIPMHAAIGTRLMQAYGEDCAEIAAEIALHFEHARARGKAAQLHCVAAGKALQHHAPKEALQHASQGLALQSQMAGGGHVELQFDLLLHSSTALLSLSGFGAPEVESTLLQALQLAPRLPDDKVVAPILSGLYNLYFTRASFAQVLEIAERVRSIQGEDSVLHMLAHNISGTWELYHRNTQTASEHAQRTLDLYRADEHRYLFATFGEDPALTAHHNAALACWISGSPESAQHHLACGHAIALRLQQPFGEAQMLWMEVLLLLDGGQFEPCEKQTARLIALCTREDFPMWLAGAQVMRAGALSGLSRHQEAIALVAEGMNGWAASGAQIIRPFYLAIASRIHVCAGDSQRALSLLDEGIACANSTQETWYLAELHRHRAMLRAALDNDGGESPSGATHISIHDELTLAVELARAQGAALFEEKARTQLAHQLAERLMPE